jgi:hypothetical protein
MTGERRRSTLWSGWAAGKYANGVWMGSAETRIGAWAGSGAGAGSTCNPAGRELFHENIV